jgi:ElaB/YqjD/DUF883 family membrane-anchored ribosome-binding protein
MKRFDKLQTPLLAPETVKSIGEEVRDFAGDVGHMAGKQFGRAQDMAVDTFDETYAAMNPLLTLGIALGIGFAFGVLTTHLALRTSAFSQEMPEQAITWAG